MKSTYCILLAGVCLPFIALDIWHTGIFLLWIMKIIIVCYLIIFGILPLVFHYSYTIQKKILFLNFVYWPVNVEFDKPEILNVQGARNFYLHTNENVKIGLWQLLPESLINDNNSTNNITDEYFDNVLKNTKKPVILYMHGNSGNRASSHRIELYKLFQKLDYHVITFDYRSYGDSDAADLSESGVVYDSTHVFKWLYNIVDNSNLIFVWGHSLGTGVSSHTLAKIAIDNDIHPAGLFLESPFNNIADELRQHPFAQIFKHLPWFEWLIVSPYYHNHLRFESDKHIGNIKCSIMIMHAEDDRVIPFALGEKLFKAALKLHNNDTKKIQMTRISGKLGFGHKYICRYDLLPSIIEKFVSEVTSSK
ncbi:hypothetical protein HCN44_001353 [Aphidius gifuensis]|uniref:AB hydrolase-1 domain-containing protein n=1 Tax=Aphidius gifuensis TaxID=684658 RepID=A0A835CS91_APHGI|nr:lysophosphatidylserine lipase ABHD12-like [Aphidius gifuensis]KAF7992028.1 hypothetical protein HCN44_001353 [Aphidius gifuensis]